MVTNVEPPNGRGSSSDCVFQQRAESLRLHVLHDMGGLFRLYRLDHLDRQFALEGRRGSRAQLPFQFIDIAKNPQRREASGRDFEEGGARP